MHFRALCPSVMLATLHSGVVTSPFGAPQAEAAGSRKRRRRWSWLGPRETDEEDEEAPGDSSADSGPQKENRSPRGSKQRPATGTSPIEVKRPALAAPNGLRRSPGMAFSPFSARGGIRYACSPPPPARRCPGGRSPPSPLASPPDAAPVDNPRALRRNPLAPKRRSSQLPLVKSPLTMNPNQRFTLVCLNDRFYWVSKEASP